MRIIVCPHDMGMGGSQINAIDLAAGMQDRGHEVMLYCEPGRLVGVAEARGLDWAPSPSGLRLSGAWATGLVRWVRSWRADLVHTYEWAPSLGASFGAHGVLGVPQVMTVLSMDIPRFLPRHLDLVVGTRRLLDEARAHPYRHVIEPPIDTHTDAPGGRRDARHQWGIAPTDFVVSVVGRMTPDLGKDAGVLATIDAVNRLAETHHPVVLIAAGDGPSLESVQRAARGVNDRHGRPVVIVPGNMDDPAPAYRAADVVVGMGSSVLRGMSCGKPAVVLGDQGYTRPVTQLTLPEFRQEGFYGVGDGHPYTVRSALQFLAEESGERRARGAWARSVVEEHYSLLGAVGRLEEIYRGAIARRTSTVRKASSLAYSAAGFGSFLTTRNRSTKSGGVAA
ncbi:glycosyltransferase family 4 protein [Citricoccus sp.]|uniref:glycosyltransferase family 4 protein n=1 Tax=Citricoccus sp. TaxID=1978372 RepID=UPI0028BE4E4A|nr:glycosyltransferase family 4 protein [Citricoccus sp.]